MEILGNMNSIKALHSIINNLSFGYLSENLKGDLPGGGLLHQIINLHQHILQISIQIYRFANWPLLPLSQIKLFVWFQN
jgi:hypothetical protein